MPREESLYPADWIRIAERDLRRVERLLDDQDPEGAGFHLQQAVEKFLKAFLLSKGWKLQRIHNLEALLTSASAYDPSMESFREACQRITDFYLVERYPLIIEAGLTEEDVRNAFHQVSGLVEKLRSGIAEP